MLLATMTPRTVELLASAMLIAGGLGLLASGHFVGGAAAVAVGAIALIGTLVSRR